MPQFLPADFAPYFPVVLSTVVALFVGWLLTHLIARGKLSAKNERIKAEERRATEIEKRLANAVVDAERSEQESQSYRAQLIEIRSRLDTELKSASEKQALLERTEKKLAETFKSLSADSLRASSEQLLQLAKTSLAAQTEEAKKDIQSRHVAIESIIKPVADSLGKFEARIGDIEKARESAYSELKEQVRHLGESQLGLQQETASLVRALRQPSARGQWGEIQLRRVVELAGMLEYCDFETQHASGENGGLSPDLIVRLPGGKTIVVDSKTPMNGYLDALEANSDAQREEALQRHARQVREHIEQLSAQISSENSGPAPEFTVLFLPGESFFSAALQAEPDLIERGVNHNIILATPTTLIALLRAVAYGWRQEALAENAREISAIGRTLHERLVNLAEHFTRLGRSLESSVENYNIAVTTLETRVLSSARKFEDLKATPATANLPHLSPIDTTPRSLHPVRNSQALPVPPPTLQPGQAEALTSAGLEDDFTFVPPPPESAQSAAADLRAAL